MVIAFSRRPIRLAAAGVRALAGGAALAALLAPASAAAQQEPPAPPARPHETQLEEQVTVRIGEVQVLVTDKNDDPIRDLKPEEVEVKEGGDGRRLAYLEPFATRDLAVRIVPQAAPLGGTTPTATGEPDEIVIKPPRPRRNIVLLFDAFNSRTPDRERWLAAARRWVGSEMRDDDRVSIAVMERGRVNVIKAFTSDRELLGGFLSSGSFLDASAYHDYMLDIRSLLDDLQTCINAYEKDMCSLAATQSYLFEWRTRTEQTAAALGRFAASLAAIPGRKGVFYISNGLVLNPGEMATNAVLGTFGTDVINRRSMDNLLSRQLYLQVQEALRTASSADVTFFTFDTRHSSQRDQSWTAEQRVKLHERRGADPFAMMFDETRGSLDTVAVETGGRSYHGPKIEENLPRAIDAIEGLYTVGFYRDPSAGPLGKVKIKVSRAKTRVSYPDRFDGRVRAPRNVPLELAALEPRPQGHGILLPLATQIHLADLSFDRDEDDYVASVSLFAEAISPNGEREAETFELVEVRLSEDQWRDRASKRFVHALALVVAPGAYRVRVRISESAFAAAAERAIDVTVRPDATLEAGIQESVRVQESERQPTIAADGPP